MSYPPSALDPAGMPGPFLLTQLELLHLSGGRPWQRVDELDRLRRLEPRDVCAYVFDQDGLADLGARAAHDERLGPLAPFLVRHAYHRDLEYRGVRFDDVFD